MLSNNLISVLNSTAFHGLHLLRKLDLSNNDLEVLSSDAFRELRKLNKLDIRVNEIYDIPRWTLATLHSIEYLYIHFFYSKPDTTIDDLRGLTKLKVLDIVVKVNVTNSTFHPLAGLPIQELRFTWVLSCKNVIWTKNSKLNLIHSQVLRNYSQISDHYILLGSLRSPLQTIVCHNSSRLSYNI